LKKRRKEGLLEGEIQSGEGNRTVRPGKGKKDNNLGGKGKKKVNNWTRTGERRRGPKKCKEKRKTLQESQTIKKPEREKEGRRKIEADPAMNPGHSANQAVATDMKERKG